jgi:hypothetical protein
MDSTAPLLAIALKRHYMVTKLPLSGASPWLSTRSMPSPVELAIQTRNGPMLRLITAVAVGSERGLEVAKISKIIRIAMERALTLALPLNATWLLQ